jgi:hypothetical protein
MSALRKSKSRLHPRQAASNSRDRRFRTSVTPFWHLIPLVPLLALLLGVLIRDVLDEPPAPAVTVLVQKQPEKATPPTRVASPVFKAVVKDEPPEFDQSLTAPQPVKVSIIDEKEERLPVKVQPVQVEIKDESEAGFVAASVAKAVTVDPRPRVLWQYGPGMRFGIGAVETKKLLTFSADGTTNQTMLRVNGQVGDYGGPLGRFLERDTKLAADRGKKTYGGSKSVWVSGRMQYTQILELVPSNQPVTVGGQLKLLLDTVRVRYLIENKETKAFKVGLRIQIDTLIGGNDGVPFTVPGLTSLVSSFADFPKQGPIPDFIQALERPNLRDPGTVAHMSLKLEGAIEPPTRVSLTHWPRSDFPNWDVPLAPLNGDSAVVLYWNDKPLKPGETREMGFAYGLGNVASGDPGGKLGVTLGGSFEPGEAFSVTAYVQGVQKGQTLALELPQGLERIEGSEVQKVPPPSQGALSSIVSWKVKVLQTGTFPLKVVSSNGLVQARTISIARPEGAPEPRLAVDLSGSFEPGQEFTVQATLVDGAKSVAADSPVLTLPAGLTQSSGPLLKPPASADPKESAQVAAWKVKVLEPGKYSVRVEWGGAATTKTLTIVRPETPAGGYFTMTLGPPFAPGKSFTVTATVSDPIPGQTLRLQLPAGLRLVAGNEEMPVVPAGDAPAVVRWEVFVYQPGTYPLRLISSGGVTLRKTIAVEQGKDSGGSFLLDCIGNIAPGKEFTVQAKVTNPLAGQKLTLLPLPEGLELVDSPAARAVPSPANGTPEGLSAVAWRLRVTDKGILPVRVASTTGVVQSFTITITVDQPAGSIRQLFGGN